MLTVEFKFPGTLKLDVPEFVRLDHDTENNMVSLNVDDANIKKQKEMWGTLLWTNTLEAKMNTN